MFYAPRRAGADSQSIARNQAIIEGVNWLIDRQSAAGGWEPYSLVIGNSLAVRAYAAAQERFSSPCALLIDRLKRLQSPDGSWDENITGTAHAVWALIEAGEDRNSLIMQNALGWLRSQARRDCADIGTGNTKNISLTLIALLKAGEPRDSQVIVDGITWLKANQNFDGFWGAFAGESSVAWVKEAVIALILAESESSPQVRKALEYLRAHYSEYSGCDATEGFEVFISAGNTAFVQVGQAKVLAGQNEDFGWGKFPGWPSQNIETARAVLTLAQSGYESERLKNALAWMESHISETGDYGGDYRVPSSTAWAVLGLSAAADISASLQDDVLPASLELATGLLMQSQNGGWAWWSLYHPEVIGSETDNTGLCVWSLYQGNEENSFFARQQAAASLSSGQNRDGGWGGLWRGATVKSTVSSTNFALLALLSAGYGRTNPNLAQGIDYLIANRADGHWESVGQTAMSTIIIKKSRYDDQVADKAATWLLQSQNDDGGWGPKKGDVSTVASTSMAMLALAECEHEGFPLARGAAWLLAAQNDDGGWGDLSGAYASNTASTAQAVWALSQAGYPAGVEFEIVLDRESACPGDQVVVNLLADNEITSSLARIIDPQGNVTSIDLAPAFNDSTGQSSCHCQATCSLDISAPAGTYTVAVDAYSPAGDSSIAATFAVYPLHSFFRDADADGWGNPDDIFTSCQMPPGYVMNHQDSDDSDPNTGPRATKNSVHADCPEISGQVSGSLEIKGAKGRLEQDILIGVKIKNTAGQISSFGFQVTYDAGVLEYTGFESGELLSSFLFLNVNPVGSGCLKVGGLTSLGGIPQDANGYLVWLKFTVRGGQKGGLYPIQLKELRDHLACFSSSHGSFVYLCPEDLNGDENVTLDDVALAFHCYLESGLCADYFDLNHDGEVTPLDALQIYQRCREHDSAQSQSTSTIRPLIPMPKHPGRPAGSEG